MTAQALFISTLPLFEKSISLHPTQNRNKASKNDSTQWSVYRNIPYFTLKALRNYCICNMGQTGNENILFQMVFLPVDHFKSPQCKHFLVNR
jgi:hypothetical protein